MAHPDLLAAGDAAEEGIEGRAGAGQIELSESVFAFVTFFDGAAQQMSHELLAVADAEDRGAGGEQRGIDGRAAGVVDAGRAAGDDDAFTASQGGRGGFAGGHFGVDAEFADLAGDEMTVLSSGVEDGDLGGNFYLSAHYGPAPVRVIMAQTV